MIQAALQEVKDDAASATVLGGRVAARVFTPEQYGATGDGATDDTDAVRDCFDAANARARTGVVSTIQHPGATVQLNGRYNLSTLSAPIDVKCDVLTSGAEFIIPAAYAGVAVRVGHLTSGSYFQSAKIHLPDIVKPTSSAITAGSVACRVQNFGNSELVFGRILYFETGQHYTGDAQGAVYLDVFPGYMSYVKTAFKLKPDVAGGWANQITFRGGSVQQSSGYAGGTRLSGWTHVEIDGNGINNVDEIRFIGTSFEGDVSANWASVARARNITFTGCRHEQGNTGAALTFAGGGSANVTWAAHGLAVGDMVTFTATAAPTGLNTSSPYFVISAPDANTITVSQKKGGTASTFSTAGTSVLGWRPPRLLLDSSVTLLNVQVESPYTSLGVMEVVDASANGTGNGVQRPDQRVIDAYQPDDLPLYKARNRASGAASRPAFAAYPTSVKPWEDPKGWSTALGDRGLMFAASGAETALLFNSGGVLSWQRAGQTAKQVGTMTRAGGLTSTAALACGANAMTTFDVTLTGAAVNDYAGASTVVDALPAGIIFSHARVSATDTVQFAFYNATGSTINLTVNVQPMTVTRFF
jgi:hypothetical protein